MGLLGFTKRGTGFMEPHLMLAFALRSNPGAYALLLGAGVSVGAGVPSAWGVQEHLIRRLAQADGENPDEPFAWYEERYGKPSTYDDLLASVTHTAEERQALLRDFFEPTVDDREAGQKTPQVAHQSIAQLVSSGLVKIILTTNFDRLTESALRGEGIEPTIAASPADIAGLAPLHTQRCLVVHVHGDYLNPTSMLNTAEELGSYPPGLDRLLDRVFDEYGLIIGGWSATWDTAMRNAVSRCPTRRFATYWIDPYPLSSQAADLRTQRQGTFVQATADDFFGRLAEACAALEYSHRRHPATAEVAVGTAKRALAGHRTAISLHDAIKEELDRVRSLDVVTTTNFDSPDANAEHARRLARLEAGTEVALALIATTAYWGDASTDQWWFDDIERFARWRPAGGSVPLINLVRAPATMLIYAAGVAVAARERWPLMVRLLTEPTAVDPYTGDVRVAAHLLDPAYSLSVGNASKQLYEFLYPLFTQHLALGEAVYQDAWERFEYLRLISQEDQRLQGVSGRSSQMPHLRATGRMDSYKPLPSEWLRREFGRLGDTHPLLASGLADGSRDRVLAATDSYDAQFGEYAKSAVWARLEGRPGTLPVGPFYPLPN
jgi:SIR2-like domain